MTDLTNITTPLGLLEPETEEALRAHGGPYEYFSGEFGWKPKHHRFWRNHRVYRVAKPKPTPLIVHDWDALADDIVAVARDEDGGVWLYDRRPYLGNYIWEIVNGVTSARGISTKIIDPGTCDWREAIAIRPGVEQ